MYVVGIGASAGGLEAIHELFDNMPDDTGFSFVIVQHLSPDYKSLMPQLLARHSQMQIHTAEDGMELQKNCIYLIPNKSIMTLRDNRLVVTEKERAAGPNTAIDTFMNSLAHEKGKHAVAVILSGTGTDGTNGIESVKANGGIVIVQDPISAGFDGMPNSAINTGFADMILTPDMIASELCEYVKDSPLQKAFFEMNQKDEVTLRDILEKVYKATSHDFSHYKRPTILRRLSKRMALKNIKTLSDYLAYINNHKEEPKLLSKEFLIGVTKFFRDQEAFDELRAMVLPSILNPKRIGEPIKVWVLACSTGEEAYSIAISICEYLTQEKLADTGIKIFATDIDEAALEVASKGIYPADAVKDMPQERVQKFFIKEGGNYRISPAIRKMVVFANHNVLKDPPFSKVDLLSCRNMLIYMGAELQKSIMRTIHFALNPGGCLFLGPSENIGHLKDSMKELSKKWKLYRNMGKAVMVDHARFSHVLESKFNNPYTSAIKTKNALNNIPEIFNDIVIEEYKYAGIYIDKEFEVKQAIGNFKSYITFPEGHFNMNLLKLVSPDLSVALSSGVRRAIKNSEKVTLNKLKLDDKHGKRVVNVVIRPYLNQDEYLQPFLFIVIHEIATELKAPVKPIKDGDDKLKLLLQVEEELKETKENLQAAVEELETANEELQSSNEEMISANEELQSTNEELQSLNEELHTVNAEHQMKIRELIELNDDLNNYFNNTDIGQLLVDRKMLIRKFSPAIKRQINLIEADIGRSIVDISNNFVELDFINNIKSVMKTNKPLEKEITLNDGKIYHMRISPYIRLNHSVDGVVITFIDITQVRQLNSIIESIFNSSTSGITAKRAIRDKDHQIVDFEYMAINQAAEGVLGRKAETLIGKRILEEYPASDPQHFQNYKEIVESGQPKRFEYYDEEAGKWYDVVATKMMDGLVTTFTEITDKKQAAEMIARNYEELKKTSNKLSYTNVELEQSNYDLLQFASVISHDLKEPLRKIQTFGNLLQQDLEGKFSEKEKLYLEKMIRSSERMRTLIDDLLSFSKLSNKSIQFSATNLNDVIKHIIDDLEIQVKEQDAEIRVSRLPSIEAVSGQMHQLFQNLISNALKFVKDKPVVTITEESISEEMARAYKIKAEEYVYLKVSDNGIGFEEQYAEKIFGLFQRLTNDVVKPGTGIGLAICRKIAENHNGFISAESEPGKGATFTILLPKNQKAKRNMKLEN